MRQAKQSDSPSGYDREVRPKLRLVSDREREIDRLRARVAELEAHEQEIRRVMGERLERRSWALLPYTEEIVVEEFGTEVTL